MANASLSVQQMQRNIESVFAKLRENILKEEIEAAKDRIAARLTAEAAELVVQVQTAYSYAQDKTDINIIFPYQPTEGREGDHG